MTDVVIGLDFGSSSVKAAAYDRGGHAVASGRAPTPSVQGAYGLDFPVAGVIAAGRAATRAAAEGCRVAGIGLTSMGEVGAVLGPAGDWAGVSFPAWHDDRGADVVERLRGSFPLANGRSGGHLRPTSSLAKLAWLAGRGERFTGCFLGLCGLLAERWTGECWQEASLASTSGAFDPVAGVWMSELWEASGLVDVRLPDVRAVGSGTAARSSWARFDRVTGALVVIAGHDHPVAAVGTGSAPGSVVDSLGTGEPVMAAWTTRRPEPSQVSDLVEAGLTIETWPSTGDPLLIWEGLRPGLAMATVLATSGLTREALEVGHHAEPAVCPFGRGEVAQLEQGDPEPLRRRGLSDSSLASGWGSAWRDLLAAYARDAARGEGIVRAATGASGPVVFTGGGIRSQQWLAAKRAATTSETRRTPLSDSGTRGAAAIVGAAIDWWEGADRMPREDNE